MIDFFDTDGIYFIAFKPNGPKWNAQVAGTSCSQVSMRGRKDTWVTKNNHTSKYFTPNWWYNHYHWFEEGLFGKELKHFTVKGLSPDNVWEVESKILTRFKWRRSVDFTKEAERMQRWEKQDPEYQRFQRKVNALYRAIKAHPKFLPFKVLTQRMERAINRIKPKHVERVRIVAPFQRLDKVTVALAGVPTGLFCGKPVSVEAWVYVQVTHKSGRKEYGVITWQNCD